MDEPTTGVDPTGRLLIRSCIQDLQKYNKTLILASHSMDEYEYLCNRVAIMANGKIICIGSVQHLKNRFGKGFLLNIILRHSILLDTLKVKAYLVNIFRCILKDECVVCIN